MAAVDTLLPAAVSLLQDLVRIPSENLPPTGHEEAVQRFYRDWLRNHGVDAELTYPEDVPGFTDHPARLREHDMTGRPNVTVSFPGAGGGRSLLVLAHADVMPAGPESAWTDAPFSGRIADGCLYGRGAGDDKGGMAITALLPLVLREAGIRLAGDLTLASVADEEFGGGNGTAALLASGIEAEAVVYLDGSNQTIWNTALGGGFGTVRLAARSQEEVSEWAGRVRATLLAGMEARRGAIAAHRDFGRPFLEQYLPVLHPVESHAGDARHVNLTFFLNTLPGEDEAALKREVERSLDRLAPPEHGALTLEWMSRFLKPAPALPPVHPLLLELGRAFEAATGRAAVIGPGVQSDQGLIRHFGRMPCVLFGCGRRGRDGAPHEPDECVALDEFKENLLTAAIMAVNWCGKDSDT